MKRTTIALLIAVMTYVLAWLLPVADGGTTLLEGGVPGWEAFRVALAPVWPYEGFANGNFFMDLLSVGSALTNFVFIAALAVLSLGPRTASRGVFWGLLSAALLNAHWFVLVDERSDLFIGYYMWVGSFLVLAARAHGLGNDGHSDPVQEVVA